MSLDVFGRKLDKSKGDRGPPGTGYKFTKDGQYDVENKRISNLAGPIQQSDAVNLDTLQRLLRAEIKGVMDTISRLRSDIDNLDILIETHRDEVENSSRTLYTKVKDIQDTIYQPDVEQKASNG